MKTIGALLLAAIDYVADYLKQRKENKQKSSEEFEATELWEEQPRDEKGRFSKKRRKNNGK